MSAIAGLFGVHSALGVLLLFTFVLSGAEGLRCFQCGQYNDGVGSITPCINYTTKQNLRDCPKHLNQHCIKYVTEGSVVRDCAAECTEKRESWGTKIFCCKEEGCNGAVHISAMHWSLLLAAALLTMTHFL